MEAWTSVSNELPKECGRYLCVCEEQTDLGLSYVQWNCSYNAFDKRFSYEYVGKITHWMPLPEYPEK